MAADSSGNDISAVGIPVTGFIGIGPYGTALPTSAEGKAASLSLDAGITKCGLITTDGGFQWTDEPSGDPIEFWQRGYSIKSGDATTQLVVKFAQYDATLRKIKYGLTADANGYMVVKGGGHDTQFVGFTEEIYKNGVIRRRAMPDLTVNKVSEDRSGRGSVLGNEVTFDVNTNDTLGGRFGEWLIPTDGATPPSDWAATTEYAFGDVVELTGGEILRATAAGTSDDSEPTAPALIGATVVDGTVTWYRVS